jgi:hypothetical protein
MWTGNDTAITTHARKALIVADPSRSVNRRREICQMSFSVRKPERQVRRRRSLSRFHIGGMQAFRYRCIGEWPHWNQTTSVASRDRPSAHKGVLTVTEPSPASTSRNHLSQMRHTRKSAGCIITVIAIYVGSVGPAYGLTEFQLNGLDSASRSQRVCEVVYRPIYLVSRQSTSIRRMMSWYLGLWSH